MIVDRRIGNIRSVPLPLEGKLGTTAGKEVPIPKPLLTERLRWEHRFRRRLNWMASHYQRADEMKRPGQHLAGAIKPRYGRRLLRQRVPARPARPRARRVRLAGAGIAVPASENAVLNVGGVVPPTISIPTRSQSGSRLASRVHACRSVTPRGNGVVPPAPVMGLEAESQ